LAIAVIWLGLGATTFAADKQATNADAAFAKLKTLVGTWEAETERGKAVSTYELVANGTALVEHVSVPGDNEMLTVYHLDGDHLVLTHYCSAGNQPRMQAKAYDPAAGQLVFDFTGGGNLSDHNAGHMHSAVVKFVNDKEYTADWTFQQEGKPRFVESLRYRRIR
jgi:hypothetical protein